MVMTETDFVMAVRHICWCCYQLGAGQPFNPVINEDQKDSLRQGVEARMRDPHMSAEENHENWMRTKIKQGWVYGPVKDFEKKTHPDLVPYDELPEVERLKDTMDLLAHDYAAQLYENFRADELHGPVVRP